MGRGDVGEHSVCLLCGGLPAWTFLAFQTNASRFTKISDFRAFYKISEFSVIYEVVGFSEHFVFLCLCGENMRVVFLSLECADPVFSGNGKSFFLPLLHFSTPPFSSFPFSSFAFLPLSSFPFSSFPSLPSLLCLLFAKRDYEGRKRSARGYLYIPCSWCPSSTTGKLFHIKMVYGKIARGEAHLLRQYFTLTIGTYSRSLINSLVHHDVPLFVISASPTPSSPPDKGYPQDWSDHKGFIGRVVKVPYEKWFRHDIHNARRMYKSRGKGKREDQDL
jgi:hypothetical protein